MKSFKSNLKLLLCLVLTVSMMMGMMAPAFAEGEGTEPQCTMNNDCTLTEGHSAGCPKATEQTPPELVNCEKCGLEKHEGGCACTKADNCPAESHEADCLKKLADDAAAAEKAAADQAKIAEVNALIAALPDVVTNENYDAVMAQLEAIKAYESEMGELWNQLDLVKLEAVINATYAPVVLICTPENCEVTVEGNHSADCTKVVATIGEGGYTSLAAAFAVGGEIKLLKDVVLSDTLHVGADKTITLNLNGKTISQEKACTASYEMIRNDGKLSITGGGKISFTDTGAGDPSFGWGSYTINNNGVLSVENATIENLSQQNKDSVCHMYCAIFQYSGSTVINSGVISTPTYRSVRLWSGSMTLNGGVFEGQVWVQCVNDNAKLVVNGGSYAPRGVDGSSVFVGNVDSNGVEHSADFTVNDGNFETKIGANKPESLNGPIKGGVFSESAKNNTSAALITENFKFADEADSDGNYGIKINPEKIVATIGETPYFSLAEAFAVGGEIKLLKDVELSDTLVVAADKTITLDLGGKTITTGLQSGSDDKHIYAFDNLGTLYIAGPGTINARGIYNGYNNNNPVSSASMHIDSGVTINAIDTNGGYGVANYGTIYIDGAKITAKEDTVSDEAKPGNYDASAFANFGTATINSGTFESTTNYTYAITNQGTLTIETAEVSGGFGAVSNLSGSTVIKNGNYEVTGANGGHAVYAESGTVTIQNGTFTPNSGSSSYAICTAGANAEVAVVDGNFGVGAQGSVCVTTGGGEVNLQGGSYDGRVFVNDPAGSLEITGGTFSEVPDDKYIHEEYKSEKNTDGKFEVAKLPAVAKIGSVEFTSFEKALEESKSGDTIVLLADVAGSFTLGEGVTLDLNGKTLTGNAYGTVALNKGKWKAPVPGTNNTMFHFVISPDAADNSMYISENGVFVYGVPAEGANSGPLTMQSGTVTVGVNAFDSNKPVATDLKQSVTIGSGAEFVIPAGKQFAIRGNAVVNNGGKVTINGDVLLGGQDVTDISTVSLTAPVGLNITSGVEGYSVIYDGTKYYLSNSTSAVVAKIGDANYGSFDAAVNAAGANDTITLQQNIGTVTIENKSITINPNGKTIGGVKLSNASLTVGKSTVTMADGTIAIDASGKLTATPAEVAKDKNAAVSVNGTEISFKNNHEVVNKTMSVVIDEKGNATVPGDGTVKFNGIGTVSVTEGAVLKADGSLVQTPAADNTKGYAVVEVTDKDGNKDAVLVPINVKGAGTARATLTIAPKDGKLVFSTDAFEDDLIIDDKGDLKDYLEFKKADTYFYKYGVASMKFIVNGYVDALNKIVVQSADGKYYKELGSNEAEIWRGSTEIKLYNSYLKNLELGKYTLTVSYDDGQSVSTSFTVGKTPATGDNGFGAYAAIMAVALAGMAAILVLLKKKSRA